MIDAIQLSNDVAKLSDWMKAMSTPVPTTAATAVTFQRAVRRPMDSAASEQEYRLRMFVAIGPCMTSSSTGIVITPKTEATSCDGSVSVPDEAMEAPSVASQTVGTNIPSAVASQTWRSL